MNNDTDLRQFSQFHLPKVINVFCETESISFLAPKIWNIIIPNEFKKGTSLDAFKKLIKKWHPENCSCRLCKSYIQNLGFEIHSNCFLSLFSVCTTFIAIYFSILFG